MNEAYNPWSGFTEHDRPRVVGYAENFDTGHPVTVALKAFFVEQPELAEKIMLEVNTKGELSLEKMGANGSEYFSNDELDRVGMDAEQFVALIQGVQAGDDSKAFDKLRDVLVTLSKG